MKPITPIFSLAVVAMLLFVRYDTVAADAPTTRPEPPSSRFNDTRDRLLRQAQIKALTASEQFELATALLGTGQFGEALVVARLGMGLTQQAKEKGLFCFVISQCYGAKGNYASAAEAALEGQRFNPLSVELAAIRFGYFTKLGNAAQAKAAEDTLKQLEPSGQPVMTGGEWIGVIMGIIQAVQVIYAVGQENWSRIEPEVKRLAANCSELWSKLSAGAGRVSPSPRTR